MSHLSVQELSASLDGVLTGPALEQVAAHLATCHECRDNQARLAKHDDALRRLLAHDPNDRFIDELARRSEALVVAILRGLPAPPFATTMPLQAEEEAEDAHDPPKPASAMTATKGKSKSAPADAAGAAASEAGYGRIGMKPTGSTQAPGSDPEIARRLLEDIERAEFGNTDTFEGVEPAGSVEPKASDSGRFKPPGWTPSPTPPARESALTRAVEKSIQESFRPDVPVAETRRSDTPEPPRSSAPPAPEAATTEPAQTPPRSRQTGFGVAHARQPAWERLGLEPDPFSPGVYRDPLTGASIEPPPLYARRPAESPRRGRSRLLGPAAIAALATVGGLLVLVLLLRTPPVSGPGGTTSGGSRFSLRLPRVEFVRKPVPAQTPARTAPDVRDATTQRPVDHAVPKQSGTTNPAEPPRVCGQVVDLAGKPLAGVMLTVDGVTEQVRSDAEGRFCLTAAAGPHVVRIQGDRAVPQRITLEFAADAPEFRVLLP